MASRGTQEHSVLLAKTGWASEAVHRGVYAECEPDTAAWRDKRRKTRENLMKRADKIDERGDGYALRP